MRYWTLCLASMLAFFAVIAADNKGITVQEANAQTSTMQGDLKVQARTDTSISGVYGYAGTAITFTSTQDNSSNTVYTNLIINGEIWQTRRDLAAGTTTMNGTGNSLSIEEQNALIAMMEDLDLTNIAGGANPLAQEDLLYRMILFLTDLPVGWQMPVQEDDASPTTAQATPVAWTARVEDSKAAAKRCEEAKELGDLELISHSCQHSDNDGVNQSGHYGIYYLSCETKYRTASYDWSNKCFGSYSTYSGPGTTYCKGRCGANCGRKNGLGVYSQDCLDHDRCVTDAGSRLAPGCTDEASEAYGDAVRGSNNCSKNGNVRPPPFNT